MRDSASPMSGLLNASPPHLLYPEGLALEMGTARIDSKGGSSLPLRAPALPATYVRVISQDIYDILMLGILPLANIKHGVELH